MITPFEVYVVMQLDVIREISFVVCLFTGLIALPLSITYMIGSALEQSETHNLWPPLQKLLTCMGVGLLVLAVIPSTKTAAAMIVLPAITSDEVVKPLGDGARELYDLAKQALKKAVDAPVATNEPKVEKSDD